MHIGNIHRILRTSLAGCIFIASALLVIYFGPWLFASPQVPLPFLWLIWNLFPTDALLKLSIAGIIFATLIGIPQKWWWGIVICLCFATLLFTTNFNPSDAMYAFMYSIFLMLYLCIFGGMLRLTTQFPGWVNPSSKIVRHFLELAMILILISTGLFLGGLISSFSGGPILFLSVYKTVQAKNWQIQKMEILPNSLGDYYETIRFELSDGSTNDCLYNHFFAEQHGYDNTFDFKYVIICRR